MSHDMNSPPPVRVPIVQPRILLVEDEHIFARAVEKKLSRSGFECHLAADLKQAVELLKSVTPDLILLDMRLPDGSGLDFLSELRSKHQSTAAVIVMSAYGELEDAVAAMKLGASDYLKKPVDMDELLLNVQKVLDKNALSQKLTYSAKRESHAVEGVEFIGECQQIVDIREQIEQICQLTRATDSVPPTVLILGETGTGKDVVARMLHAHSSRSTRPYVHVDCASLPKDLIEAELFGHEKGAFTNAHVARTGLIEAAEDGVLFLDEIGELPPDLQSKLLAVLERRTLRRVGTTQERPVAAWFISATNRELDQLVKDGEFRSDLYYRLNVLSVVMPPLRERGDDMLLLANHFASQTARRYGLGQVNFSEDARKSIMEYSWPGNVREMKHYLERVVLLSAGSEITAAKLNLNQAVPVGNGEKENPPMDNLTLDSAELMLIKQALERTNWNVSKAARELGVTRMVLRYRMKKYNL